MGCSSYSSAGTSRPIQLPSSPPRLRPEADPLPVDTLIRSTSSLSTSLSPKEDIESGRLGSAASGGDSPGRGVLCCSREGVPVCRLCVEAAVSIADTGAGRLMRRKEAMSVRERTAEMSDEGSSF